MCDQTQVSYLPGDIVWVKLSSLWWPAEVQDPSKLDEEVTAGLKKQPLAVVKFFNEEAYEYPKNLDQIYHYNCLKKDEFIKKGLDLLRAAASKTPSRSVPSSIEKFPNDVRTAEEKTNGDPQYINNPKFAPSETKIDDTKEEYFETKQNHKRTSLLANSSNLATPSPKAKFSIKKLTPKSIKSNLNSGKAPNTLLRKNKHPKSHSYNPLDTELSCVICESFTTRHFNVLMQHTTSHFNGTLLPRPPVIPRRYLAVFNENARQRSQKLPDMEEPKIPGKLKRKKSEEQPVFKKSIIGKPSESLPPPKKRNKRPKSPPPEEVDSKQEVAYEILKDWSDSEDESDSVKIDLQIKADPNEEGKFLNSQSLKKISVSPIKSEKSCFDFEDNEESLNVDGALKFGQKLPRVINEKHCSNRLRSNSKTDDNTDQLSKEVDSFLETINVPDISDTITSLKDDNSRGKVPPPPRNEIETPDKKKNNASLEEHTLKKKNSDVSNLASGSPSSQEPLKTNHPVKRSLSESEKDSKHESEEATDELGKKSQRLADSEINEECSEQKKDETKVVGIHLKESEKISIETLNVNEDKSKEQINEAYSKEPLSSPVKDENISNSSPHFLSINEVKMKPPEKSKKEETSEKKIVSKNIKGDSPTEIVIKEKHDKKPKTKDSDLDCQSKKVDNQKTPNKSDKLIADKKLRQTGFDKEMVAEQAPKHRKESLTADIIDKLNYESDKYSKRTENSSRHERGSKHRSDRKVEMVGSSIEGREKPTKHNTAKSLELEIERLTKHHSEKHVKVEVDKSSMKRTEKYLDKNYQRRKQDKIRHSEKHIESENKLDAKDKYIKKSSKLENEKSKAEAKKQKKHKTENVDNSLLNQEKNKISKKIKKLNVKDSLKVEYKLDRKYNQTELVKETINNFAVDLEKASHRKGEVIAESLKLHPLDKKNSGDLINLNIEKTFIKTSSSTFLSEPDIQSESDQQLEDSNISCNEAVPGNHPNSDLVVPQKLPVPDLGPVPEVLLDQEKIALNSSLNASSIDLDLSDNKIQHTSPQGLSFTDVSSPTKSFKEVSVALFSNSEQFPSQKLAARADKKEPKEYSKEFHSISSNNDMCENQETDLIFKSEPELNRTTTLENKALTEVKTCPPDTSNIIPKDTDQPSNITLSLRNAPEEIPVEQSSIQEGSVVSESKIHDQGMEVTENNLIMAVEQPSELPNTVDSTSRNTDQLHNEADSSKSTFEQSVNIINEINKPTESLVNLNILQTEEKCDNPLKTTSDNIKGSLVAEDLDIKSMPIEFETDKPVGPLMEIMVGLRPFERIAGAKVIKVYARRKGEPFPKELDHLVKTNLKFPKRRNENSSSIYGLKKVPFPKYKPEGECEGDLTDSVDRNTNCINDFNNNPKKLIIPFETLNLKGDIESLDQPESETKSTNPLKVSDSSFPKQVLITMPKTTQADNFKVPGQQIISNQSNKCAPAKGAGKVLVCSNLRQIKTFTPSSMVLSQASQGSATSKPVKQISISKIPSLVQTKPGNIILNGNSLQSLQVSGIQHIIPLSTANKQTEKEKTITSKLQQNPIINERIPTALQKLPNILQRSPKTPIRLSVTEKIGKTQSQTTEPSVSANQQTVVHNLQTSGTDRVLLLDLGSCTVPVQSSTLTSAKVIRVQNPKNIIKTSGQDILAEAIANTKVLQPDLETSESMGTTLTNSVLETSLTLNQPPIMSPLEVPSSVNSGPVSILSSDQPTIFLSTPVVIDPSNSIVVASEGSSSDIEGEQKLIFSGMTEQQNVDDPEDNVLPEFLKGNFSKKSKKKCDSSDR